MLLCKKELHRSATENCKKFYNFTCTSPVQITATANFSWAFFIFAHETERPHCLKSAAVGREAAFIGVNIEDYFH